MGGPPKKITRPTCALVLRQPWASLVASGRQTILLRKWPPKFRGDLVIVASHYRDFAGIKKYDPDWKFPLDVALAIVTLLDVRAARPSDREGALREPVGNYALVLSPPIRLVDPPPIIRRLGMLSRGFLPLTPEIQAEIRRSAKP